MPEETSSLLQHSVPSMASHTCKPRGREHVQTAEAHSPPASGPAAHLQPATAPAHHDEAALQLQAPNGAVRTRGPGEGQGALLWGAPLVLGGLGQRGPRGGWAQGWHVDGSQPLLLVHSLHQAAEVVARAVASAAAARPVPRLRLSGLREPRLHGEVRVDQAGEVRLVSEEGRWQRALGTMPQGRAVPRLLRAALPAVRQPLPALLALEPTATAAVPALPAGAGGQGEDGRLQPDGRGLGLGLGQARHLPGAGDAREAVPGLCIPHAHVARQAAAHQQHAIAGQALDVLRGTAGHGHGLGCSRAPARPPPPPPSP